MIGDIGYKLCGSSPPYNTLSESFNIHCGYPIKGKWIKIISIVPFKLADMKVFGNLQDSDTLGNLVEGC